MGLCLSSKQKKNQLGTTIPPSFIYIPVTAVEQRNDSRRISAEQPVPTWSNIQLPLFKKRSRSRVGNPDFNRLYRKSDIVDKKLFLNCGFLEDDIYSIGHSLGSPMTPITPITPACNVRINATNRFSKENLTSPSLEPSPMGPSPMTSSGYQTALRGGTLDSRAGQESADQITTFISSNASHGIFSFDESVIRQFQASSLKPDIIGVF